MNPMPWRPCNVKTLSPNKRLLAALPLLLLLLPGCAGYRLGSMLPDDIKTVHVPTILNQSGEPLVENDVTRAIIGQIQRDGSLRIAREDEADSILVVTLRSYDIAPLSFTRATRTQANEYRITLAGSMMLLRPNRQDVIIEAPIVRGDTDFPFGGDMTSAKRQALPDAARDFARDVVRKVVEAWSHKKTARGRGRPGGSKEKRLGQPSSRRRRSRAASRRRAPCGGWPCSS